MSRIFGKMTWEDYQTLDEYIHDMTWKKLWVEMKTIDGPFGTEETSFLNRFFSVLVIHQALKIKKIQMYRFKKKYPEYFL